MDQQLDYQIFYVDHEIISRRYKHVGVLGKGRDFMYEVPSVIHMMQDKFNEKKVIMQIFPALNEEILKMKLYQLKQSNFDNYISNWIRIIGYTTKKQNKSTSDLIILYQVDGIIGPTLENIISKHKKDNQSFSEQEILEYIYIMCESMKVSQTSEYLDLSPVNIFVPPENTPTKAKYYISNCGLSFKGTKWDKKFYCPTDSFFTVKISERNAHMATISNIFIIGMVALQMATFNDLQDLYVQEDKMIREDLLIKKLDDFKKQNKKIYSEQFIQLLTHMLSIKEERRLLLKSIFEEPEYQKLFKNEKQYSTQIQVENSQKYEGMLKGQVPEGNGKITYLNQTSYSGNFSQGLKHGYGVFFDGKGNYIFGEWEKDKLKSGGKCLKGQFIYEGQLNEDFSIEGKGALMYTTINNSQNSPIYYEGDFQDGQKTNGLQYYKDGFKYIGEFKQDKKQGKGQLFWPKSVKNWVGEFIDDQMHGKGKMTIFRNEESKEIEVEFEKGIEKNGQEI